MRTRADATVVMPESMNDAIESQLGYNDSKSEWMREALLERLEREGVNTETIREDIEASPESSDATDSAQAAD